MLVMDFMRLGLGKCECRAEILGTFLCKDGFLLILLVSLFIGHLVEIFGFEVLSRKKGGIFSLIETAIFALVFGNIFNSSKIDGNKWGKGVKEKGKYWD